MVFRWFAGRALRRNLVKDLRIAGEMPLPDQRYIAEQLARRMATVERHVRNDGIPSAIAIARDAHRAATRDRHVRVELVRAGLAVQTFHDTDWLLAATTETWMIARIASFEQRISMPSFRKIDAAAFGFIAAHLEPALIKAIIDRP